MTEIKQILDYLKDMKISVEYQGDVSLKVDNFSSISDPKENSITWLRKYNEQYIENVKNVRNLVIVTTSEACHYMPNKNVLIVQKPKMVFFEVVKRFFFKRENNGISKSSVVKTCHIGKNVTIGDFCTIGKDVIIGDDVVIKNSVSIDCPTVIGNNCNIASGVVIGSDGFGYYEDMYGNNSIVPHTGGVVIGNNVDIGANTCIDRGTIGNTEIGDYVKIDNLCHIAHNVKIGKNVFVIANSMIGGSAVLDDDVYIAPGACVINQASLGKRAFVGMGAVVTKDVNADEVVAGAPAHVIRMRKESDRE